MRYPSRNRVIALEASQPAQTPATRGLTGAAVGAATGIALGIGSTALVPSIGLPLFIAMGVFFGAINGGLIGLITHRAGR
jgi:hypothetical protein